MGITGGLACHLFSFLIGFGLSSILSIGKKKKPTEKFIEFNIFDGKFIQKNKIVLLALVVIVSNQFLTLIQCIFSRFRLTKLIGTYMISIYFLAFVCAGIIGWIF